MNPGTVQAWYRFRIRVSPGSLWNTGKTSPCTPSVSVSVCVNCRDTVLTHVDKSCKISHGNNIHKAISVHIGLYGVAGAVTDEGGLGDDAGHV